MPNLKLSPNNDFSQKDLSACDLSNRDLSHSNLSCSKLNGSDLSHARLNGANLQEAQLYGANLTKAKLCGAQLPDAKLNGADLTGADLTGADFTGADLQRADLRNANFSGTDLSGANVQGAQFGDSAGLTEDAKRDLKNRGAIFRDAVPRIQDIKWWMQYVMVPLTIAAIGGGGIMGVFNALKSQHPSRPTPAPTTQSTIQGILSPPQTSTTKLTMQETPSLKSTPTS